MKISILLPFRNAAPWIEATVDSIVQQTIADWELIAINDHSTDATASIIENFDDSRIYVIQNSGEGIIPALQSGLKVASGDFITRMDADDLMPKDKLKVLVKAVSPGRKIITGKVQYFGEQEVSEGYRKYEDWLNERIDLNDHFDHVYRECVIASPNWLVLAEFLKEDRIFEQLQYPEDYDLTFLWKEMGYEVVAVNEVTHLWREHPKRTSRNSDIYDQESFFRLKLNWFAKTEKGKTLGVFGTGVKGKRVVTQLQKAFEISWFDHENTRITSPIEGFYIKNPEECTTDLLLIAVYPDNRKPLEEFVRSLGYEFGKNVWYV